MQPKKTILNLSSFLSKGRQYHEMKSKATLWFGAILSLVEENQKREINDDLDLNEKISIIKLITETLTAIANFYEQERPNSVYKLLNFASMVFDLIGDSKDYAVVMNKVNYLNSVSIYGIKTHQYSFTFDIFNQILEIYHSKVIDNVNEVFVIFFSNYLIYLRKSNKKMTSKLLEAQDLFKELFIKYFTKVMLSDQVNLANSLPSITLITAIYKQNQILLSKYQKDLNSIITHLFQIQKTKKKLPDDMTTYIFTEKIKKSIYFTIKFSEDQLKFYSSSKSKVLKSRSPRLTEDEPQPERLTKIEAMLGQSIEMLNDQKIVSARYAYLQRNNLERNILNQSLATKLNSSLMATIQTTKASAQSQLKSMQTLQPLPRTFTRKRPVQETLKPVKQMARIIRSKPIIFKIRSIFIEINEDGILLSDYTKQNKRYVEWNTVSLIIQKIEQHFPFQEFLKMPVENYYDFVRIISFYLTKNDNRQICLSAKPLPLLEVNELIKLYKQEGKYLKLALMNHYDTEKFVGIIDCYITEFSQFFKNLNENEYCGSLNEKIIKGNIANERQQNIYLLDYIKRKRETTLAELGNQLKIEYLEHAIEEKNTLYKSIFLLKNNLQLYVKIIDNIKNPAVLEGYLLEIQIQNALNIADDTFYLQHQIDKTPECNRKISKLVQIPLQKLTCYFPVYNSNLKEYVGVYSRMIVDMLNNFQQYSSEINLGSLAFEIVIHGSKTETVEYGKYFSIVSAQLVGSKERVWAMIIRYYDMAFVNEKLTVLMNPYHDFLQGIIGSSQSERMQIIKNLLVNQSVKETYLWLKKTNKLERRLNIFQYLYANQLI